jgi:beta-mannosidase
MLGRFVDAGWAYRFGPPAQDLIALTLERDRDGEPEILSQAFRFPAGRPSDPLGPAELGLTGALTRLADGGLAVRLASRRFAHGVRIEIPGHASADDAFGVEPGHERLVELAPAPGAVLSGGVPAGALAAINLAGHVRVTPLP